MNNKNSLLFTLTLLISLSMNGMNREKIDNRCGAARSASPIPYYVVTCTLCKESIRFTDKDYENYQASEDYKKYRASHEKATNSLFVVKCTSCDQHVHFNDGDFEIHQITLRHEKSRLKKTQVEDKTFEDFTCSIVDPDDINEEKIPSERK